MQDEAKHQSQDSMSSEPSKGRASERPERKENLFLLGLAPSLWLLHLLACYVTVAIHCEKIASRGGDLNGARVACIVYTVVALGGIATCARLGHRRHRFKDAPIPHDFDTSHDRHRFLGFAEFLLSVMSFAGVIYVAFPLFVFSTCR